MPYVKTDGWPVVLPDDDGIRPAGPPDACLYCGRKIGEEHGPKCVCVNARARWRVEVNGLPAGWFEEYLPAGWERHTMEFRMNEGSWCASNALDRIVWDAGKEPEEVTAAESAFDCCCNVLSFDLVGPIDPGPYVMREKGVDDGRGTV